jgi:hypothetical protein
MVTFLQELIMSESPAKIKFQSDDTIQPVPKHVKAAIDKGWAEPESGLLLENTNDLLNPGYLPLETGYARLPNGQVQVACLTHMPGCQGRMINWWFGWLANSENYRWWHPRDHAWTELEQGYPGPNNDPDDANYIGYAHLVHETIGGEMNKLRIQFVDPSIYFDTFRFKEANVSAVICARASYLDKPLKFARLIHLIRDTDDGCEMRSRFWAGDIEVTIPLLGPILSKLVNTKRMRQVVVPDNIGPALLIHCAEEMNHLAGFLPALFHKMTDPKTED